ncbi:unnamed protein product, partial [Durusdinium trenchii]
QKPPATLNLCTLMPLSWRLGRAAPAARSAVGRVLLRSFSQPPQPPKSPYLHQRAPPAPPPPPSWAANPPAPERRPPPVPPPTEAAALPPPRPSGNPGASPPTPPTPPKPTPKPASSASKPSETSAGPQKFGPLDVNLKPTDQLRPLLPTWNPPPTRRPTPEELEVGFRVRFLFEERWWAATIREAWDSELRVGFDGWPSRH